LTNKCFKSGKQQRDHSTASDKEKLDSDHCYSYSEMASSTGSAHPAEDGASSSSPLSDIRHHMKTKKLQALIITHSDAHSSEYISERDERLAFVSGFTGSAGTALVTLNKALLWTDGRYFTQAALELSKEWELMKSGEKDVPTLEKYLADLAESWRSSAGPENGGEETSAKRAKTQFAVGVDAEFASIRLCERIQQTSDALSIHLIFPSLVNQVWDWRKTRPLPKPSTITILPLEATGRSVEDKIVSAVTKMRTEKCDTLVVSALDDIAWMLNARGAEIPFNPVFFAYMVITDESDPNIPSCTVYTDHDLSEYAKSVRRRPYSSFFADVTTLFSTKKKIWIDASATSAAFLLSCSSPAQSVFRDALESAKQKLYQATICIKLEKPKKTPEEIAAMKRAQVIDGAAVSKFLAYVASLNNTPNHDHTEYSLAERLEQFRKTESPNYAGNSFETISSFGENGAIIHYKPKKDGSKKIVGSDVYLLDSGGHYSFGGTTDTTRTVWLGRDTSSQQFHDARKAYTYVLKAHVALAMTTFPSGILPSRLDSIPRAQLWSAMMDYNHGTGHGVGSWLCVHELPPLISSVDSNLGGIVASMCVTNEPGYYVEGKFGFRIENLMFVEQLPGNDRFCRFETITYVPYCRDLTDPSLLTKAEIEWINAYHVKCREALLPRLEGTSAVEWFMKETAPL